MAGHGLDDKDRDAAVLSISGMTCGSCANSVTRVLSSVPGVASAKVDLASGRAFVTGTVEPEELVAAVQAAGYGAYIATSDTAEGGHHERGRSCCC